VVEALRRLVAANVERNCLEDGLGDRAEWLRVLAETPALQAREREREQEFEDALAAALEEELDRPLPRLVAGQYLAAKRTVMRELRRRLSAGEAPAEVAARMLPFVHRVFDHLERGLAGVGVRTAAAAADEPEPVPAGRPG
jgi:hypothetical protein